MKKLITILAIIMSCFIITSCDEKEEKIKSTSNSQSIWAGVYSFTEYDDDGNALYKAQLTVTKLTDEEFLKSDQMVLLKMIQNLKIMKKLNLS